MAILNNESLKKQKTTINDIAEALGVSKTTVSRSISGKGRISEETRNRVLEYIKEHDYKPNQLARGLASSKTYNIGWIVPGDSTLNSLPFFQNLMNGVTEVAFKEDYDILAIQTLGRSLSGIERVVSNGKVDGVILGCTLVDDPFVKYLKKTNTPFVVIGTTPEPDVLQIENDHKGALIELLSAITAKGVKKFAFICGSTEEVVNVTRKACFENAVKTLTGKVSESFVYTNCDSDYSVYTAVDRAVRDGAECIIASDDRLTTLVMNRLSSKGIRIPEQMKVASLYNSESLERCQPPVTSLDYDSKKLGEAAARVLIDYLNGEDVEHITYLGFDVLVKGSTM